MSILHKQHSRYERLQVTARLLSLSVFLVLASAAAHAAIITVGDDCTLVDAITAANDGVAVGGCVAGGAGGDTIRLTQSVVLTDVDNMTNGPNGLPVISSEIRIRVHGFDISREIGSESFRLFAVAPTGHLTLVEGGLTRGEVGPGFDGGMIRMSPGARVDLVGMSLAFTVADRGSAIWNSGGTLTLFDTGIGWGSARESGGAIFADGPEASVFVVNGSATDNEAPTGGAFRIQNGATLDLVESAVERNVAEIGGGVSVDDATARVDRSTLHDNGYNLFGGRGGGLASDGSSDVTITGSTFHDNGALQGGALYSFGFSSSLRIANSTVAWNRGGSGIATNPFLFGGFDIENTIVAFNDGSNCDGMPSGNADSLSDDTSCVDFGHIDFLTDTLEYWDSDSPTRTLEIDASSDAVDAGGACDQAIDQRRHGRDDANCDSGAFEYGALKPPTLALSGTCPGPVTLEVANATPNSTVVLVRGATVGRSEIPGGVCAGVEHLLDSPRPIRWIATDADGTATLQADLGLRTCRNLVQVVDLSTCLVSRVKHHPAV